VYTFPVSCEKKERDGSTSGWVEWKIMRRAAV
jgi:hypothetical protein